MLWTGSHCTCSLSMYCMMVFGAGGTSFGTSAKKHSNWIILSFPFQISLLPGAGSGTSTSTLGGGSGSDWGGGGGGTSCGGGGGTSCGGGATKK